jgi:hypothetical protein
VENSSQKAGKRDEPLIGTILAKCYNFGQFLSGLTARTPYAIEGYDVFKLLNF